MATEPDPDSRPITVEELIARTADEGAFPRADPLSVRRAATGRAASGPARDKPAPAAGASATTASGMPAYTPPAADKPAARVVGASGMPAHAPAESANVVTGIIPVVTDDPDDVEPDDSDPDGLDTGSLRAVERDDLIGEDLPTGANAALVIAPAADVDPTVTAPTAVTETETAADAPAETVAEAPVTEAAEVATDPADTDTDTAETEAAPRSAAWGWLGLAGEVVLGVLIGGGLFWGFTVLWQQYVYFALLLAVLVIFAIVTFAYVLRKRDLPTTLLALAVGLIVTIGPLVMLV